MTIIEKVILTIVALGLGALLGAGITGSLPLGLLLGVVAEIIPVAIMWSE